MTVSPLDAGEELMWRSLMRVAITVPRVLSEDLERSDSLTNTEYAVLMHLSEAPDRRLRMSDLAERLALSAGRITRMVDQLNELRYVAKVSSPDDGRSMLAVLQDQGFAALERAYPHLLASVRRHVFDHITADEARAIGPVLHRLAAAVDQVRPPRVER